MGCCRVRRYLVYSSLTVNSNKTKKLFVFHDTIERQVGEIELCSRHALGLVRA